MAALPDVEIHYELREFHGDYDLCRVNADGTVLGISAEVHDRDIVDRIAEVFNAEIVPEFVQGTLPA